MGKDQSLKERSLVVCGLSGPLCTVTAAHNWKIWRLKLEIESETGISVHEQNLLAHLTELDDCDLLSQVVPHDCQHIFLVRRHAEQAERLRSIAEMSATCAAPGSVDVSSFTLEDRHAALSLVRLHPGWFSHLPAVLRANRRVTLAAVQAYPLMLEHADPVMQADKELVLVAVDGCLDAFAFAHESLRSDVEFVASVMAGSNIVDRLLDDPEEQLSWERSVLRLASPSAQEDPRLLRLAGLRTQATTTTAGFDDDVSMAPAVNYSRDLPVPLARSPLWRQLARTRSDRERSRSRGRG